MRIICYLFNNFISAIFKKFNEVQFDLSGVVIDMCAQNLYLPTNFNVNPQYQIYSKSVD
jgi:hypothetical protein